MKLNTSTTFFVFLLLSQILVAQPPIPENAREHFVIGATLFKDAQGRDDYVKASSEFQQAVDLAPGWAAARYNLGLAQSAAKNYWDAIDNLKMYLTKFKLSDSESRAVQDKIYEIKAKIQLKAEDEEAELDKTTTRLQAQFSDLIKSLEGAIYINVEDSNDYIYFTRKNLDPTEKALPKPYLEMQDMHDNGGTKQWSMPFRVNPTSADHIEQYGFCPEMVVTDSTHLEAMVFGSGKKFHYYRKGSVH